ncbi:uncharacterized protein TrAFT101_002001 [Trichoderma asperellum]|uniref:uncharacterized protein n=1 Tax=Trichoderma asperellum TaxID=101201 RepID=UPI0033274043|nr:hypothetical protein TrAFT101_002001 [Trichoderma asperellum]
MPQTLACTNSAAKTDAWAQGMGWQPQKPLFVRWRTAKSVGCCSLAASGPSPSAIEISILDPGRNSVAVSSGSPPVASSSTACR